MSPIRYPLFPLLVSLLAASTAANEGALLAPRLSRRIAVEDQPVVLEVSLPEGMPLTGQKSGPVVGGAGIQYRYLWELKDAGGEVLRVRQVQHGKTRDRWETAAFMEPYTARFPGRLSVSVEVTYLSRTQAKLQTGRASYPIPRVQDVTPPVTRSQGDEDAYPPFVARSLTVEDGGVVTTTDRLVRNGGNILSRSPFTAVIDDGRILEGSEGPEEAHGSLEFSWANLWDNLNQPFAGKGHKPVGRFALYLSPRWDLAGSHHLVSDAGGPYMAAQREVIREDGEGVEFYLIDLTDQLPDPPEIPGAFGGGRVRIPLPYDRVGDLEVGFYAEDSAWPSPNHVRPATFRFRVEDDIAPTVVVSLQKKRREGPVWLTADSVNHRWHSAASAFGLPEVFKGPPLDKVLGLGMKVQTAYGLQVMAYDNTRLAREGLKIQLVSDGDAGGGFGFRVGKSRDRLTSLALPVDGFDPSLARTPRDRKTQLYFSVAGKYRLLIEIADVHGNLTRLEVPFVLGDREVDWIRLAGDRVRLGNRRRRR